MPSPVDIAFVCAMPIEMEPIAAALDLAPQRGAELSLWAGDSNGRRVVGVVTGMGPSLAGAGIDALPSLYAPERVAVVGITGAVQEGAPIGALVQVTAVIDGATGARYLPAGVRSLASSPTGGVTVPGDAVASLAGALWTTAVVITDPNEIRRLGDRGVVAMDMETAIIARRCREAGITWDVFRTVSDIATDGSVGEYVAHIAGPDGSVDPARRDAYFAANPHRVEAMDRLAQNVVLACDAAAAAAMSSVLGR